MCQEEKWCDVIGYEGLYSISTEGKVMSLARLVHQKNGKSRATKNRILAGVKVGRYIMVVLAKNGVNKTHYLHTLVLTAFSGARPKGYDACHNDGN